MRVPAGDIEGLVLDRLRALFLSRIDVGNAIAPLDFDARTLDAALRNAFKHSEGIVTADGSSGMSLGTILLIILVIALLGGFSGARASRRASSPVRLLPQLARAVAPPGQSAPRSASKAPKP